MARIKKSEKRCKKVLTNPCRFGILTKLSDSDVPNENRLKIFKRKRKKWLTNEEQPVIIAMFR
ncbi:MAG: hypothetical protein PHE09_14730 [Oscillospiraceae bacterium]|nr:hypothetical protein [Oscillospiraceae bacterium]